jgi:hypothetical protein
MSHSAAGPEQTSTGSARRDQLVTLLVVVWAAIAFQLRITVSPQVMNTAMNYTSEGGAFIEKLHFGTYAVFLLLPLALFARPFQLRGEEIGLFRMLVRYGIALTALIALVVLTGRAGSSGFVIDTYLVAGAAGLIMLTITVAHRRLMGDITVMLLIASALIGILEAVTRQRILPYDLVEAQFRPIGLSVHPLALGALCAAGIGFVALTRWRVWIRLACMIVLFIGAAASGARLAFLLSGVEVLLLLWLVRWPRLAPRQELLAKSLLSLLAFVAGAGLIAALFAGGLLNRFSGTLFDENFMARVTIYRVFEFVGWREIMLGMNVDDLLTIVREKLHLPYIESAPVVLILLFGLPVAIAFVFVVFRMLFGLLRGMPVPAWIGTIVFLLAALSNNTLSSKTPEILMLVVLLLAYRPQPRGR